jgi:uncharacterized protein (TIGR02452 family)
MDLRAIAEETLRIAERGGYAPPGGTFVDLAAQIGAAVAGTRVFAPPQLAELLDAAPAPAAQQTAHIEVTDESTQTAARRLAADGAGDIALLNFASAKNVGGGFLGGARAQEEDLARCSALYPCLCAADDYYGANRACGHLVYTDHMVWSPRVPFFRVEDLALLPAPFLASVITAPAPNGEAMAREWPAELAGSDYESVLRRRAGMVLALAEAHGHRDLVLGAWGCGVFRNDPALVADAFARWLETPRFQGSFARVVFAVWGRPAHNLPAFRARFPQRG